MAGKSVDEVCEFLFSRQLSEEIIDKFRHQKVDGKVIQLISNDHLRDLGLNAIGDIITLREHCSIINGSESEPTLFTSKKTQRRRDLLDMLKNKHPATVKSNDTMGCSSGLAKTSGRPKKTTRAISFGLRMSEDMKKKDGERIAILVKSPLGDKNTISIHVDISVDYYKLLSIVTDAFFPNGANPVIGDYNDFVLEIVNSRNQNVKKIMKGQFTIQKYIEQQKIPGTPKCYMLCTALETNTASDEELEKEVFDLDGGVSSPQSHTVLDLTTPPSSPNESYIASPRRERTIEVAGTPTQEVMLVFPEPSISDRIENIMEDIREDESNQCGTIYDNVQAAINAMEDSKDPVEMLRIFQQQVMKGRPLETTPAEVNEGETASIFVSRHDLLPSAMQEILNLSNDEFSLPLDVTFYGEKAQDLGGPRREFFRLVLKELLDEKNELFEKMGTGYVLLQNQRNVKNNFFYGAGILCCLSMLQQGPLPCFMEESHMTKICSNSLNTDQTLTEAESQFQKGFNILGIVNLISRKPVMKFLLRSTAQKVVTYKQLMNLLEPCFSEKGTTRRSLEETVYNLYTSYLKEVAAGRREGLTLGSVLQFTTGSEFEPVLGFKTKPSLVFRDDLPWSLPQANTCICQLTLPSSQNMPTDKETLFSRFDLSFANAYFGFV